MMLSLACFILYEYLKINTYEVILHYCGVKKKGVIKMGQQILRDRIGNRIGAIEAESNGLMVGRNKIAIELALMIRNQT